MGWWKGVNKILPVRCSEQFVSYPWCLVSVASYGPISRSRKLKLEERRSHSQGHIASKLQILDSNPGRLTTEPKSFIINQARFACSSVGQF